MHIEIQLYLFLVVYLSLIFVSIIYLIFTFYHLFRFGSLDVETVFLSFFFLAVFALILFISYQNISKIDWQQNFISLDIPEMPKVNFKIPFDFKKIKMPGANILNTNIDIFSK